MTTNNSPAVDAHQHPTGDEEFTRRPIATDNHKSADERELPSPADAERPAASATPADEYGDEHGNGNDIDDELAPPIIGGWWSGALILVVLVGLFVAMFYVRSSAKSRAIEALQRELGATIQSVEIARPSDPDAGKFGVEIRMPVGVETPAEKFDDQQTELKTLKVMRLRLEKVRVERSHFQAWGRLPYLRQLELIDCEIDFTAIGLLGQYRQLDQVNLTGTGVSADIIHDMHERTPRLVVIPSQKTADSPDADE